MFNILNKIMILIFIILNTNNVNVNQNIEIRSIEQNTIVTEVSSYRDISYQYIDSYTDLSIMKDITVNQLNKIIEYWNSVYSGNSPFINQAQIFIEAALETGLDPVYILAHAAVESAWGTSYYATNYHNYFGIGAFDDDPDNAIKYNYTTLKDGIIQGAKWIKENYYNNGQTSLFSMRYNNGYHEYCTSTTWIYSISDIIRTSYSLIE